MSSLPLSLRSTAAGDQKSSAANEHSIAALLHRIGRQRASFRNFTEESLLKEIGTDSALPAEPSIDEDQVMTEVSEVDAKDQDLLDVSQSILDEVKVKGEDEKTASHTADTAIRDQVVQLVAAALNESALALDFTSLLLSSTRQAAAESMSPALRASVPAGSLSHTRVRRPPSSKQSEPLSTILGFKARGLTNASAALTQASTTAREDHETDGIFWEEIQALMAAGWTVFRPRPGHAGIAVRFGPQPRHYILLEKDAQGHIDTSKFDDKRIALKLSVKENSSVKLSKVEPIESTTGTDDPSLAIIEHLTRARKSLLNSTVFDELVKEARECANLGLTIIDREITIPLGNTTKVCIELLELEGASIDQVQSPENKMQDLADESGDAEALLSCVASMIYSRYSATPKKHPVRTLLSSYRHGVATALLQSRLGSIFAGLAALEWTIKPAHSMVHAPNDNWDSPFSTNFLFAFLTRELTISVKTTLSSVTTFKVVSSAITATGLPVIQRQTETIDVQRVFQLVMSELMEATQEVLSLTNGIVRCAENAVRINGRVVTIIIGQEGQIRLSTKGTSKTVKTNLAPEILDPQDYQP